MKKKIIGFTLAALAIFAVITQPDSMASSVKNIFHQTGVYATKASDFIAKVTH